jgi:hypothetical protein
MVMPVAALSYALRTSSGTTSRIRYPRFAVSLGWTLGD